MKDGIEVKLDCTCGDKFNKKFWVYYCPPENDENDPHGYKLMELGNAGKDGKKMCLTCYFKEFPSMGI